MKKVIEEHLEFPDHIQQLLPQIDFSDTFSTTNHVDNVQRIAQLIFDNPPKWVMILFLIRNTMVRLLGLKTNLPDDYNTEYKVGGYMGFFRIYGIKENELILGMDDSHLNFRAVISKGTETHYNIKTSTLVEFNNKLGKIYMTLIKPFHKWVVKRLVKKAYRAI